MITYTFAARFIPILCASSCTLRPKSAGDVPAGMATTCFVIRPLRPLFTSATCERRNITADFTSCHDTRSSRGALGFPHLASLNRASHPSIITISVSSSPAAQPQSFGSSAGSHASPTLRMVAIALSSLSSQPQAPQTFAAFSKEPVSQTVVTTLRSSAGDTAPRPPLNSLSRNGVSHPRVDLHCPHTTLMRALPNDVSTSMPMRLARLRRLPSEPTDGSASAMDWSASSNLLSPSAITSRRIPASTSASDSGVCAAFSQIFIFFSFSGLTLNHSSDTLLYQKTGEDVHMKSEKFLAARIDAAKRAIAALGDMRPGHLSVQQRASGRNRRGYAQLSYTFQKRSRTDYVQPEDVERIKSEIANYRKFKELCERLVALSIEESKRKTEQRRKALAAVRSQS